MRQRCQRDRERDEESRAATTANDNIYILKEHEPMPTARRVGRAAAAAISALLMFIAAVVVTMGRSGQDASSGLRWAASTFTTKKASSSTSPIDAGTTSSSSLRSSSSSAAAVASMDAAPSSSDASHSLRVETLRRSAASISVDMLLDTSGHPLLDVGPFVDVVNLALDTVGVRGVLREVFETQQFREAVVNVAKKRGVLPGLSTRYQEHQMSVFYEGLVNDQEHGNKAQCTGCLWWLRHYVGAAIADKLIRDGSLRLDAASDERITSATAFMQELQRLQRLDDADFVLVSTNHAFVWQYVAATMPDLNTYPTDLLKEFCGEAFLVGGEWSTNIDTDIGRECRHSFGHAIFYLVARRGSGLLDNKPFSARTQFRPHKFTLDDKTFHEGEKICHTTPNKLVEMECFQGLTHSMELLRINGHALALDGRNKGKREGNPFGGRDQVMTLEMMPGNSS